jgi:uncharacterized ion transporter superfamily protein YfcC
MIAITNMFKNLSNSPVAALPTWIIPAGEYQRRKDEATGREVVIAGTYARVTGAPVGLKAALLAVARLYSSQRTFQPGSIRPLSNRIEAEKRISQAIDCSGLLMTIPQLIFDPYLLKSTFGACFAPSSALK